MLIITTVVHYNDFAACDLLSQFNTHVLNRDYQTKRLKKSVHSFEKEFYKGGNIIIIAKPVVSALFTM